MPDYYYRLPLRLDLITSGGQNKQDTTATRELMCSLEDSLWNHIYLILTTPFREVRFDDAFGSAIWEYDLNAGSEVNETRWESSIKDMIEDSVRSYEKRLESIKIAVKLNRDGFTDAHRRLTITVTGYIRGLNRQGFTFQRDIIIAPFIAEHLR
ncbi:GPW/gp25 family protein [Spirosoma sp.]|uniref:GPW/gp25 family protein n=1 Tax=Spirosoma sp. TaxID=1899569 RepID=UPI002613DED2|nr:GPW/gp25 family protein [Spirosoma sp.]MCX6216962.1 GPW/gp25 family protein [Spirosoma sp.]